MTASANPRRSGRDTTSTPYGYFDGVIGGEATGWCWRPSDPTERLEVEVVVDGLSVARGPARRRRENVARAGYGDGRYGFSIPLPAELADGGRHRIAARVEGTPLTPAGSFIGGAPRRRKPGDEQQQDPDPWSETKFVADDVPAVIPAPAQAPSTAAAENGAAQANGAQQTSRRRAWFPRLGGEPTTDYAGYVDGVTADELFGWVVDRADPSTPLSVEAFFDRQSLGVADADVPRGDLARTGYGERHGFRFALGGVLRPGIHLVEVRLRDDEHLVPLASDYIVVDSGGAPIEGVSLRAAEAAVPPPWMQPPTAALLGLDGWLFDWPGEAAFDLLRGAARVTPEIAELQHHLVLERHDLVRSVGAQLVEAVVPAKLAVYRESLPTGAALIDSSRPADLLAAAMREYNAVELLDLSVALRHACVHGDVFPRTARGLTWLGGFAAYRAIAKQLARGGLRLDPIMRSKLAFAELAPVGDPLADLPRMVWVGSSVVPAGVAADDEQQEGYPRLEWSMLSTEYAVIAPELAEVAGPHAAMLRRREQAEEADRSRALVIHDGSADRIAPFLSEHFDETFVIGAGAELEAVLSLVEPVVVVEVVAESTLLRFGEDAGTDES